MMCVWIEFLGLTRLLSFLCFWIFAMGTQQGLSSENSPLSDELVIVSPHWDGIQKEFTQAFQHHYQQTFGTSIEIRWRDLGGTSQIEKTINALYAKNSTHCDMDILWGEEWTPMKTKNNASNSNPIFHL